MRTTISWIIKVLWHLNSCKQLPSLMDGVTEAQINGTTNYKIKRMVQAVKNSIVTMVSNIKQNNIYLFIIIINLHEKTENIITY